MSCHSMNNIINFAVGLIAKEHGIKYQDLIGFITEYRCLPEFQRVIGEYELEDIVHARTKQRQHSKFVGPISRETGTIRRGS